MAIFDKIFKIDDPAVQAKIEANAIDYTVTDKEGEKAVRTLRKEMRDDKIDIDKRIFEAGTLCLIAETASTKTKKKIPKAITRIEYLGAVTQDPIILQPAYGKSYANGQYHVYILGDAPDLLHPDVSDMRGPTTHDIKRSIRVLKAAGTGKELRLSDLRPSGFVFMKDDKGEILRYPRNATDPEFRNQPIAFLRDLNACLENKEAAYHLRKTQDAEGALEDLGIKLKELEPAPQDCVDACKRQYLLTETVAKELRVGGIIPNIDVPPMPWASQFPSGTRSTQIRKAK